MESAHAFVKSQLLGPQQTFTSVIQLISNAIEKQYHEITTKHAQQKITSLRYLGNFFRLCLGKITNYAIRQAYKNLDKAKSEVPLSHCNQRYNVRMGILCKHWLLSMFQSGKVLSPDEFHAQWQMSVSIFQLHAQMSTINHQILTNKPFDPIFRPFPAQPYQVAPQTLIQ
jgi:hypothetical protein